MCVDFDLSPREKSGLSMFENLVLRGMFEYKRERE
jgi:hypothetical protein